MARDNCLCLEAPRTPEDGGMVAAMKYRIERVPCALPTLLVEAGRLTRPPNMPDPSLRGYRPATPSDANALVWLVAWETTRGDLTGLPKAAGAIAYHDRFDWHTSSDIREIVFLTGRTRAIRELVLFVRPKERRLVGMVEAYGLKTMLLRVIPEARLTRVMLEDCA